MGIDFSHCGAHWAYSGFNRFRQRLASCVGIDLDSMEGFNGNKPWNNIKTKLKPLLNHSDCDGVLSPGECSVVFPELRHIVANWEDGDYDKNMALELANGMEEAYKACENFEFL